MIQYIDSFIALFVGFYAILLGQGAALPPVKFRGNQIALILGVVIVIGGAATLLFPTVPQDKTEDVKIPTAEEIVIEMKKKMIFPMKIDEKTRMDGLKAEEDKIIYAITILETGEKAFQLADAIIRELPKRACENKDYMTFLKIGITIEMEYLNEDGEAAGKISIPPKHCGL